LIFGIKNQARFIDTCGYFLKRGPYYCCCISVTTLRVFLVKDAYSFGCITAKPPPGIIRVAFALPASTGFRKLLGMPVGFLTL